MRRIVSWLIIVLSLVVIVPPAGAQIEGLSPRNKAYPEYVLGRPVERMVREYTAPVFTGVDGERVVHRWLRYWNASGRAFYTDTMKIGSSDFVTSPGDLDGISYDGHFLYNPNVSSVEGRVYFRMNGRTAGQDHYFLPHQVVDDPRLTNWWMAFSTEEHSTLFEAVESAAVTDGFPSVTLQIIDHMVESGVVDPSEFERMSVLDIQKVMMDYTDIALNHAFDLTQATIGVNALTREKFVGARPGDLIQDYYWYRYGLWPDPVMEMPVTRVGADTVFVRIRGNEVPVVWNDMMPFSKALLPRSEGHQEP